MKIELALFAVLAFVAQQIDAMFTPGALLQLMGSEMATFQLPPKPPAILTKGRHDAYRRQHMTRQMQRQRMAMAQAKAQAKAKKEREAQEMALFQRMRNMPSAELKALKERLSVTQLRQLVGRLRHLVESENKKKAAADAATATGTPGSTSTPYADATSGAVATSTSHPNHIFSGANKIRRPSSPPAGAASSTAHRARMSATIRARALAMRRRYAARMAAQKKAASSRRPKNPMDAINKYQKYQKKAMSAMAAGCLPPMGMDTMNSFFAFNRGGCRGGGMAVCAMAGQSCVDLGASITCCPPGYTSGTLDIMNYMKQMQTFMAQFQ